MSTSLSCADKKGKGSQNEFHSPLVQGFNQPNTSNLMRTKNAERQRHVSISLARLLVFIDWMGQTTFLSHLNVCLNPFFFTVAQTSHNRHQKGVIKSSYRHQQVMHVRDIVNAAIVIQMNKEPKIRSR